MGAEEIKRLSLAILVQNHQICLPHIYEKYLYCIREYNFDVDAL